MKVTNIAVEETAAMAFERNQYFKQEEGSALWSLIIVFFEMQMWIVEKKSRRN